MKTTHLALAFIASATLFLEDADAITADPRPIATVPEKPAIIPDAIVAAARAGKPSEIGELIQKSFKQRGSLDESGAKEMLDGLVRGGELPALTVLLKELRKTNYGKDWQPDDALLDELVRDGRKDFIDAMLASWLEPKRLEERCGAAGKEMAEWMTRRAAEVRKQRAEHDELVAAAGKGDLETMRRLLDSGVDVNCVSTSRHTPLTLAAREDRLEAVRLLLERGANVDQPKHPGWDYTPLCLAKSAAVAELLKAHGANVHAKLFCRDVSILTYMVRWGGPEIVEWMLKQGLDPKMIGDNNQNLLFDAGDARTTGLLLAAGVDPNHVDEFGKTPLASAQSGEIARKLIEAGAKVPPDEANIASMIYNYASVGAIEAVIKVRGELDPASAQKALIAAAHIDQAEVANFLLAHGAKANEPGMWGKDDPTLPLMVCTIFGSPKTAKVLIEHGADPNAGKKPGLLLQNAIQNRHKEVAKILWDAGAKGVSEFAFYIAMKDEVKVKELRTSAPPFAENSKFWAGALPTAARNGDLETVRAAIEKGVPLVPDSENNAFDAAASEGQYEALTELLAHRKKPDDAGELRQALWNAVWNSHPYAEQRPADAFERCVKLLLDAGALGADGSVRDSLVQTAVFTRYPGGNPKVIEMLVAAGADPNPLLDKEKQQRLSDVIQSACDQQGCSTPFGKTIRAIERLGKVSIKR